MGTFTRRSRSSSQRCRRLLCALLGIFIILVLLALIGIFLALVIIAYTTEDPINPELFKDVTLPSLDWSDEEFTGAQDRFREAIKYPSISFSSDRQNDTALEELNAFIEKAFPIVHSSEFVTFKQVGKFSRLYRVKGQSDEGDAYMLCGHIDVVPPGEIDSWSHDPFEGVIDDGYIYGRGSLDDKHTVFAILEALEHRLRSNGTFERTLYVAIGHDEEIHGLHGAQAMAVEIETMLEENNETIAFILDEGFMVVDDFMPGVQSPVALIGVSEKGFLSVNLTVTTDTQSHSSFPEPESAIGILARAVARLEENKRPNRFGEGPEADMLTFVSSKAEFWHRLAFSNMWLFSPLLSSQMSESGMGDALQRTTTALTIFDAGFKENVVPKTASAVVNLRVHPADTLESILVDLITTVDDDRVNFTVTKSSEPAPVSPFGRESIPFQIVAHVTTDLFPDAAVAPATLVANTDTRHYQNLTDHIFRYTPVLLTREEIKLIHGIDERISLDAYNKMIQFYFKLMSLCDSISIPINSSS